MKSFNPLRYSSVSSEVSDNSIDVSQEVVEKGHKNILKVDIGKFEELCKKFKDKKDLKIKKLTGEDKENFDLMINYVHLLYGTSYYSHLYEKVKKYFKNVNAKPGTIGGYFSGCMTNKNNDKISAGCSLGCAGSMPLPKDEEGWSFCDKAVIMAEKGEKGYVFSVVKPAESEHDYDPAYVFVDSKSLSDFKGFDKTEKASLKAMGCKKVKLIGYSDDMSYSEFYDDSKSVEEIKHRKSEKASVSVSDSSEECEGTNWFLILAVLIFIILLLIFLYFVYKYYKMRQDF